MEIASIFNRTALVQILAGMAQESPLTEAERESLGCGKGTDFWHCIIKDLNEDDLCGAFGFARKVAMSDPTRFVGGLEASEEHRLGSELTKHVRELLVKNYLEYECTFDEAVELLADTQGMSQSCVGHTILINDPEGVTDELTKREWERVVECMSEEAKSKVVREWIDEVRP